MAEPQRSVPEAATNREPPRPADGEEALRAAIEAYGGEYADAAEYTDELEDVLRTAIVVLASADEADVEHVTDSLVALVNAADGISTEGTVALAEGVGENGAELAATLETLVELQRDGHLDTFVTLAEAFSESLSPEEAEHLAETIHDNADEFAGALDSVLELEREGDLDDLVATAQTLSALDIDENAVAGMNRFFGAIGDAERDAESMGLLGTIRSLGNADVRAGLGYLIALLKAQGKRLRRRR